MPGVTGRFTRLMRSIRKTLSSCSLNTSLGEPNQGLPHSEPSSLPPAIVLPTTELDAFVPVPIETKDMVLSDSVLELQTRLSENLHEVWSLNKIDAGWSFGQERDDVRMMHPCLTEFNQLTENAKSYDVLLTMETLKTLAALGYEPCSVTPCQQPPLMDLSESYRQSNGYKPVPFDLSSIQLSQEIEDLIDALAANLHDIWAKNRIQEGWRYGNSEDNSCKRSPNLVPYDKIDWATKKANRESVKTIIKSLLAFGSDLRAPSNVPLLERAAISNTTNQRLRTMSSNDSTSSAGDGDNSVFLRP